MDNNVLWSLRLGFSGKQAEMIKDKGIKHFLDQSFAAKPNLAMPSFLAGVPKTQSELAELEKGTKEASKKAHDEQKAITWEFKSWWIDRMMSETFPLREKMVVFLHNHFVSAINVNYWLYQHNTILRENAFGNFRELTKKIISSNAMVRYLSNDQNRKGRYNENLSRELLELFTLGIGNYTENDIKNGAKGLAGLAVGKDGAQYVKQYEDTEAFTYLGKTGNFKANEMVDIIFEQKNAPYRITRKILKWFIYDNPPEALVNYYGDYLRAQDYELEPFLRKIFTEEFDKPTAGSKIKDPLVYILQLAEELNIKEQNSRMIAFFLMAQGMNLYDQVNVKGWDGGQSWLGSQTYQQRNTVADLLCEGKNINGVLQKRKDMGAFTEKLNVRLNWSHKGNNKSIIAELTNRLLFETDSDLQKAFENVLKHDFDPKSESADIAVMILFNSIVKTPEFQLI